MTPKSQFCLLELSVNFEKMSGSLVLHKYTDTFNQVIIGVSPCPFIQITTVGNFVLLRIPITFYTSIDPSMMYFIYQITSPNKLLYHIYKELKISLNTIICVAYWFIKRRALLEYDLLGLTVVPRINWAQSEYLKVNSSQSTGIFIRELNDWCTMRLLGRVTTV